MAVDSSVDGQFDDAFEPNVHLQAAPHFNPREGGSFIDENDPILEWNEDDTEDETETEGYEDDGDVLDIEVDDEDWEIAERDFTKQYNRLKQHIAVQSGTATATASTAANTKHPKSVAPLPAVNKSRQTSNHPLRLSQQQQLEALSKYSSRIANIEAPYMLRVGVNPKGASQFANMKDKSDRATSEQVLDPRTRIILFKMIGRGLISEVNGCVSTGKEANVYHALSQPTPDKPHIHIALKVYKTSILIFKDRDRYVTGEYRFRRGYSKRNPRKMVRLWAEKEMRNLKRLQVAGIPCPEPIEVRENVLVMGFLGDAQGWASPRLKDAYIPPESFPGLYRSLLLTIRRMYHTCKLVHADLSEYNILYHDEKLYIIDVSQSVEHDHPNAFNFLRSDLKNVEDFFRKNGVQVIGTRRGFEFVTTEESTLEGSPDNIIQGWMNETDIEDLLEDSISHDVTDEEEHIESMRRREQDDAVFLQSYIPRTLNEVYDPERDIDQLKVAGTNALIYADTIGIIAPVRDTGQATDRSVRFSGVDAVSTSGSSNEEEEEVDTEGPDNGDQNFKAKKPRGHRHEDKEEKKERKKAVKEDAKQRRKDKMPKAEKKKRIKKSRGG